MTTKRKASISQGTTPEQIGEFWDTHDLTDYLDQTTDVTDQVEVDIQSTQYLIAIEPHLLRDAINCAKRQGITVETLVNLAVQNALDRSQRAKPNS